MLIGLAGAVLKLYPQFKELAVILGGLGLLVCLAWALIIARSLDFYKYYFAWARTYEKKALGSPDQMVQLGKTFAEGNAVTIDGTRPTRLRWATRLFRAEHLMYVVIAAFAVVYVYLVRAAL